MMTASDIVLATMNARWSHASFGLRCLKANLGALEARALIVEKTIEDRAVDVVESILARGPRVVGLGVYVWNAAPMLDVVRALKKLRPEIVVVLGGPEVSHEIGAQEIGSLADFVVKGEGEIAFRQICERALGERGLVGGRALEQAGRGLSLAAEKHVDGGKPALDDLRMPYSLYDDIDVKDRVVYMEASRGCPFTCSFCLSALDDGVRAFPLDAFLREMDALIARGLRQFKFVDRTFNLKIDDAARILDFFLAHMEAPISRPVSPPISPPIFVHFEMIPDRLPPALRERLARFPSGSVQLEVGIQSFDADTCARISRRQDVARVEENLRFLADHTGAHVHADLIAGLPGEDLATFARGFDKLFALRTAEIQVGILKRLRGAPLVRDAAQHPEWGLVFDESPPYSILQTRALSFVDVQRISRFARALDLVHNSGRFPKTAKLLFADAPFARFLEFSEWLFAETKARHGIALTRLAELIARFLVEVRGLALEVVAHTIEDDLGRDRMPSSLPKRQARRVADPR